MANSFQVAMDCADTDRLVNFWAAALHYEIEPPPAGFETWDDFWRSVGVPEDELGRGPNTIIDPDGRGPRIVFHEVPEAKTIKNRLHLDLSASGGRGNPIEIRKDRVDAEAARLVELGATIIDVIFNDGMDHYAIALKDPEGNEFDVN